MNFIKQAAIIFGCLALGEGLVYVTNIAFPSSIIGLFILFFLLKFKILQVKHVQEVSGFLVKNMGLFFVPACIALLDYLEIISLHIVPLILVSTISTVIVAVATGITHQFLRLRK